MVEYIIPDWCGMHPDEHKILGGCWGISCGDVGEQGKQYCVHCEYRAARSPIVYHRLYIASESEIWVSDNEGNLVQKEVGLLDTRLLPGTYMIQFGLGQEKFKIDLQGDMELTTETIQRFKGE